MLDYSIRSPYASDAAGIIHYLKVLADEPDNGTSLRSAEDVNYTISQQRDVIRRYAESDTDLFLVAVADDEIISVANCAKVGKRGYLHTLSFGITVKKEWRGRGVGTALLQRLIEHCRQHPHIHRLELQVYTNNPGAIKLYESLGFEREGIRREVYYKHGEFLDLMFMSMLFEKVSYDES